jgi:hypothetical protein
MAQNQYKNKIIYGGQTLIDLTGDDVKRSDVLSGMKFHLPSGEPTTGTCTYDADTSDATAVAADILDGATAYKNGQKVTGTMPNRGGVSGGIDEVDEEYTISAGYHDGSGKVGIDATEQAKIIPGNIKDGITLLGVLGTYTGEGVTAQTKNVTPYTTAQTILPDTGYDYLAQVNVAAIAYTETDNAAGGVTVEIGTVAPAA